MAPDTPQEVTCYLCETNLTTQDEFCHGCNQLICGDCARNENMPFGSHEPEDHLEETDWDEDDEEDED